MAQHLTIRSASLNQNIEFDNEYYALKRIKYLSHITESISPIFYGKDLFECCLCGKSKGEVSFKKESHIVPAFLGNRIFKSHEECDGCNGCYSIYEDQLANYTLPYRGFMQIPARDKMPTWIKARPNAIRRRGSNLAFSYGENDSDFKIERYFDEKRIVFKGPSSSYNLYFAAISILKASYLCLDKSERNMVSWLHKQLENKKLKNLRFIEVFSSDKNPLEISLEVSRVKDSSKSLPELVVVLWIGNLGLHLCIGDKECLDFIIPSLYVSNVDRKPTATVRVVKNEVIKPLKESSFTLNFDHVDEGDKAVSVEKAPFKSSLGDVAITVTSLGETSIAKLRCKVRNLGSSEQCLQLGSHNFPLSFKINLKGTKVVNFNYDLRLVGARPAEIIKAIEFLEILQKDDFKIELRFNENDSILELNGKNLPEKRNFYLEKEICRLMKGLEQRFPLFQKFPASYNNEDYGILCDLYDIFVVKYCFHHKNILTVTLKEFLSSNYDTIFNIEYGVATFISYGRKINIFGSQIEIPSYTGTSLGVQRCYDVPLWKITTEFRIIQLGAVYEEVPRAVLALYK